jgi:hypothetical protein
MNLSESALKAATKAFNKEAMRQVMPWRIKGPDDIACLKAAINAALVELKLPQKVLNPA